MFLIPLLLALVWATGSMAAAVPESPPTASAQIGTISLPPGGVANLNISAAALNDGINDCDDSSFENQTSGGSPLANDCRLLAQDLGGAQTWTIMAPDQVTLHYYNGCAFGVQTLCIPGRCVPAGILVKIGNQDIVDIVRECIKRFEWNGRVGAKGVMNCQASIGEGPIPIQWGLYQLKQDF